MKKSEIKIGECYEAKVSNRIVSVRIDSTHSAGGWNATNTATGKRIRIKSAQRLRAEVKPKRSAAKATADATPEVNPTVEVITGQPLPEGDGGKAAKPHRVKKAAGEPKPKRLSALDAAAQILAETDKPMRTKELIETMAQRGLWSSPNGKTPQATLYAAILREIKNKGDQARFKKVERGQFQHAG